MKLKSLLVLFTALSMFASVPVNAFSANENNASSNIVNDYSVNLSVSESEAQTVAEKFISLADMGEEWNGSEAVLTDFMT
ncbi:hypothetical protein M3650_04080 [Paenibacillus sp. MER TA 81-3]|uniref:hypothetical protein n=1 Tax=Paenibacillus sp. MER TA 81-3 TaxID=2939573 RepID=UPI0020426BC6|nr:hypothetical protein [Paenibacillus sp. MER TA 81-3]MCM3337833.1 hypothetical protein [Paenibacillus sp. MER TA 81-3]